jgi:hypothetical protein
LEFCDFQYNIHAVEDISKLVCNSFVSLHNFENTWILFSTGRFLLLGVKSYNHFLKRNRGIKFGKLDKMYSDLTSYKSSPDDYLKGIIDEGIDDGTDKLNLARHLRKQMNIENNQDEFLVRSSLRDEISTLSALIIPIVTVLISLVSLFRPLAK